MRVAHGPSTSAGRLGIGGYAGSVGPTVGVVPGDGSCPLAGAVGAVLTLRPPWPEGTRYMPTITATTRATPSNAIWVHKPARGRRSAHDRRRCRVPDSV